MCCSMCVFSVYESCCSLKSPCLEDEDCYEEAEPFVLASQSTGQCNSSFLEGYLTQKQKFCHLLT